MSIQPAEDVSLVGKICEAAYPYLNIIFFSGVIAFGCPELFQPCKDSFDFHGGKYILEDQVTLLIHTLSPEWLMERWYHKIVEPIHCLHLQMRLEGKEIVDERFIREVEAVPGEEMPLLLIARLANGNVVAYYDEALSRDLQETLAVAIGAIEFPDIDPLLDVLKKHGVWFDVGHYK